MFFRFWLLIVLLLNQLGFDIVTLVFKFFFLSSTFSEGERARIGFFLAFIFGVYQLNGFFVTPVFYRVINVQSLLMKLAPIFLMFSII